MQSDTVGLLVFLLTSPSESIYPLPLKSITQIWSRDETTEEGTSAWRFFPHLAGTPFSPEGLESPVGIVTDRKADPYVVGQPSQFSWVWEKRWHLKARFLKHSVVERVRTPVVRSLVKLQSGRKRG